MPKPMLPVNGKPLLERQLLWLKREGISEVFLCLGYKAEAVSAYFGDGARWGMALSYSVEVAPRGTAGAVRDLAPRLKGDLLVVYGDLYVDLDCGKLLTFHGRREGAATLVLRETDHPRDSDLARLDGDRITAIGRAKPGEEPSTLGLAAVWVVRPSLLDHISEDSPSDFGRDIFPKALARGETLRGYVTRELVADLGTPERCAAFERRFKSA
jgi:NDP-sugar pyrophosphorylase family protein